MAPRARPPPPTLCSGWDAAVSLLQSHMDSKKVASPVTLLSWYQWRKYKSKNPDSRILSLIHYVLICEAWVTAVYHLWTSDSSYQGNVAVWGLFPVVGSDYYCNEKVPQFAVCKTHICRHHSVQFFHADDGSDLSGLAKWNTLIEWKLPRWSKTLQTGSVWGVPHNRTPPCYHTKHVKHAD